MAGCIAALSIMGVTAGDGSGLADAKSVLVAGAVETETAESIFVPGLSDKFFSILV